jgi:hypothetical protein
MSDSTIKKYTILILLAIVFVAASVLGKENTVKEKPDISKTENATHLRGRHEWFSIGLSISTMGAGLRLSAPTVREKNFFWEVLTTEAVFPLWLFWYQIAGGALYTKMGYVHKLKHNSDIRFSLNVGGSYFLGTIEPGVKLLMFGGFYLDPEISYVHSFNEKYAIQLGVSAPILLPHFFPYPARVFIGFRY